MSSPSSSTRGPSVSKCYFKDCNSLEFYNKHHFGKNYRPMKYYDIYHYDLGKTVPVCELGLDEGFHSEELGCFRCGEKKCYEDNTGKVRRHACQKHMKSYKCREWIPDGHPPEECGKFDVPNMYGNDYNFSHCKQCDTEICFECVTKIHGKKYPHDKQVSKCVYC